MVVPPTARRSGLRRRPTGAPPPLPRKIGTSGKGWLIGLLLLVGWVGVTLLSKGARRLTDQVDAAVLRLFARARTDWLTELSRAVDRVATGWAMFFAGLALLVAMIVFRRWRHLFTFLASVILLEIFGLLLIEAYRRPRPYDVTIIGRWTGFSLPSATIAVVSFTVVGVIYALVVPGRPRTIAKGSGRRRHRPCRLRPPVPRCRPSLRCAHRARHRGRHPVAGLPLLHPQRAVPGHLSAGQDRSPGRHRAAGRGHPSCCRRPARPHRRGA